MATILVSACLLGCACRYKGDAQKSDAVCALAAHHTLIPVCPEQMGGLSTPRDPAEIVSGRVVSCAGRDVTESYQKGAETALYLAKLCRADFAILKANSPSCGKGIIYDGTFSGKKTAGNGIAAALLLENSIPVYTENETGALPVN